MWNFFPLFPWIVQPVNIISENEMYGRFVSYRQLLDERELCLSSGQFSDF